MKRFVILLSSLLFGVSLSVFADVSELINFTKLAADTPDGQNAATLIDFSSKAGASFTPAEKAQMKTSLALTNWTVQLNSSARTITNEALSYTAAAPISASAPTFAGQTVLGIRVHFPNDGYNAYAEIRPPFDIPAYAQKTTLQPDGTLKPDPTDTTLSKFVGYGVVRNVGAIKSVSVWVYGSNNPNGFAVVLQNQEHQDQTIYFGNEGLDFDGWQKLTWVNPDYIRAVRDRALVRLPLYPQSTPYEKLVGMIIYKDAQQPGGDIITYVHDISMVYDKAVLNPVREINDEAVWHILQQREQSRENAEAARLGNLQVLRYLEQQKMATEAAGTLPPGAAK